MNPEQRRLMQVLIDYLDNFVEQDRNDPEFDPNRIKFDMSSFFTVLADASGRPCGTTACAIGHAARLPEFNAAGLFPGELGTDGEDDFILGGEYTDGFTAAMRVFGISHLDAIWLFGCDDPRSAKEEAEVLRQFLNGKGAPTVTEEVD